MAQLVIKAICLLENAGAKKPYIRWNDYVEVYNNDLKNSSDAPTKVCPKITHKHILIDSFSKMNVKLAAQVNMF